MPYVVASGLERLDVAFGRLRRLWESPALKRRFVAGMGLAIDPGVVRTLRAVGHCGEYVGVREVAAALGVDNSTASRLVDQAVVAGYLRRDSSPRDRRRAVLSITASGAEVLERAVRVREELLAELTRGWPDDDLNTLADLLERLADSVASLENRS